jgi:ribosome-associated protein
MMPTLVHIAGALSIPASELTFRFARSGGPGGQNVNKVASKAELLFDVRLSKSLSDRQRARILERLGSRIDSSGILHVTAEESRSQWANREAALKRFSAMLADALRPRKKRVPSAPTGGSRERRITGKKVRGAVKSMRRRPGPED